MAEHANEKQTTNLPGLTGERVKAGVTIVVTLYALVNAGLSLAGINPLPFTDEQVSASVFGVIGIAGTIYGWWKNQNITSASLAGQQPWTRPRRRLPPNRPNRRTRTTPWQTPTLCRAVTSSDRRRLRKMARQSEPLSGP